MFDAEVTGLRRLNNSGGGGSDNSPSSHPQLELSMRKRTSPGGNSATGLASSSVDDVTDTKVLCKYVIAADGAGSSTREAAGIGLSGKRQLGSLVNIHFRCKGLGQLLVRDKRLPGNRTGQQRPGMLYFVYNEVGREVVSRGREFELPEGMRTFSYFFGCCFL